MKITLLDLILSRTCVENGKVLMEDYSQLLPDESYRNAARHFLSVADSPYFLNGVMASSESLYQNLTKILHQPSDEISPKKKTRQTIEGAVEFYSRAAFRTTPFNTFTSLSACRFDQPLTTDLKTQCSTVINLKIFELTLHFLECNLKRFPSIQLIINETCTQKDTSFHFWFQNKTIGHFQELERNDLLDYLYGYLQGKQPSVLALAKHLAELVDEETENILEYIQQLVSMGFLEMYYHGSILSENKEQNFLQLLNDLTAGDAENRTLYTLFEELISLVTSFNINSPEIYLRFQNIINELEEQLNLRPGAQQHNQLNFRLKQSPTRLSVKSFQTVYTDLFVEKPYTFSREQTKKKLETISQYLYQLSVFDVSLKHRNNIHKAFKDYCSQLQITEVSLLQFYHYYCRFLQENNRSMEKDEEEFWAIGDFWMNRIHQFYENKPVTDSILHISLEDLKIILNKREDYECYHKTSFSVYSISDTENWMVDMIGLGYGMTVGRFLNLPQFSALNQTVFETNNAFHPEYKLAGLADDGMYNGNIHPKFTPAEIIFQRNKYYSESSEKIPLNNIGIRLTDDTAALFNMTNDESILPLNLSLQMVNQRVGLYQFLNLFTPGIIDFQPLILATSQICELDRGVKILPRITIDNAITIRRKTWFFPSDQLNIFFPEKGVVSLEALAEYLRTFQVAEQFFITPMSHNVRQRPLYCNLKNPLFVKIIKRILNNAPIVRITEILPSIPVSENRTEVHGDIFTWYVDYDKV